MPTYSSSVPCHILALHLCQLVRHLCCRACGRRATFSLKITGRKSLSRSVYYSRRSLSTAQHSTAQHSTAQHSTAQHSTAQHSTAQHSTAQHSTAQHSTAQHSTAQHSTAQHSTAQHSTAQHSTAQHSTAQHSTAQHSTLCHRMAERSAAWNETASCKQPSIACATGWLWRVTEHHLSCTNGLISTLGTS